jgi:ABC-type glutathione transport system ATPase component
VVVSHDLNTLADLCDTGVWLHQGRVQRVGPMEAVIAAYKEHAHRGPGRPAADLFEPRSEAPLGAETSGVGSAKDASARTGFAPLEARTPVGVR